MPRKTTHRPAPSRSGKARGSGLGTPADRLIRAWLDEEYDVFEELAEEFIVGGRDGVLAAAERKLAERYEVDAVEDFAGNLMEMAEAAEDQQGFDFASLVLLPVVTYGGLPPDLARLADGLAGSGAFPPEAEFAFATEWRTAQAIRALSPCAVRRVLLDVVGGRAPADLPCSPFGTGEGEVAVLIGALVVRTAMPEDDPALDPEVLDAAEETRSRERMDAFRRWRASLGPDDTAGADILPYCTPSFLGDEIEDFLNGVEPDGDTALDEIRDFVETARQEAGGEDVVARLTAREGGVELALSTRSGRELDSWVFGLDESGLTADDVARVVESSVAIVSGPG